MSATLYHTVRITLIYSHINHQKKNIDKIRSLVDRNGDMMTDKTVIATMLNRQFFENFGKDNSTGIFEPFNCVPTLCKVDLDVFSVLITKLLKKLNKHKSQGTDKIHPYIISECSDSFAAALAEIFIQSYLTSSLPTFWKEANVTPVFKNDQKWTQ